MRFQKASFINRGIPYVDTPTFPDFSKKGKKNPSFAIHPYGYNFPVLRAIKVLNKKEGKNVLRKIESFHGTPYCP